MHLLVKDYTFPLRSRTRHVHQLSLLLNTALEVLVRERQKGKGREEEGKKEGGKEGVQTRNKEAKQSLFLDNMIVYIENPNNKCYEFSKVPEYKNI